MRYVHSTLPKNCNALVLVLLWCYTRLCLHSLAASPPVMLQFPVLPSPPCRRDALTAPCGFGARYLGSLPAQFISGSDRSHYLATHVGTPSGPTS